MPRFQLTRGGKESCIAAEVLDTARMEDMRTWAANATADGCSAGCSKVASADESPSRNIRPFTGPSGLTVRKVANHALKLLDPA